jgi:hypothetical protein
VSLLAVWPVAASAQTGQARFVQALDRMMVSLGPESVRDGRLIQQLYRPHLDLLVLDDFGELELAHWNGGVAPLPLDSGRFNLVPRLEGYSPIGEKDLPNQVSYVAARPAMIGVLLDIASRVTSGPIEVTSMVRHTEYQGALSATNVNARTAVPMHTMGLAVDIALVNTSLETVYEIRDVLREMRKSGDILFVGERRQLVFHVVPHPSRLGHYTEVYTQALGMPPSERFAPVVAFAARGPAGQAHVTAEVIAVVPTTEIADEWWAAHDGRGDLVVQVQPEAAVALHMDAAMREPDVLHSAAPPIVPALFVTLLALASRAIRRRPLVARIFDAA